MNLTKSQRIISLSFLLLCSLTLQGNIAKGEADNTVLHYNSVVTILANPDVYHGKRVLVVGYLARESADTLYLSEIDSYHYIISNALDVSFDDIAIEAKHVKGVNLSYVLIEGVFDKSQNRMGMMAGGIHKIMRIEKWEMKRKHR